MTLMLLGRRQDGGCPSQWADARERVPPMRARDPTGQDGGVWGRFGVRLGETS